MRLGGRSIVPLRRPDLVFDGQPTPWQMYQDIYHERPTTIVLDDVSAKFFRDSTCQSFLKALTDTRPIKTLRWPESARPSGP